MARRTIAAIAFAVFLALLFSMDIEGRIAESSEWDGDGDGVADSIDRCPLEDASYFDRDGDGCLDRIRSARHVEYWISESMPFVYWIHEGGAPGIDDGSDFAALQAGMSAWPAVPGVDFSVSYGGATTQKVAAALDRVNLITFEDDEYYFPSAVLAVGIATSFTVDTVYEGTAYRAGQIVDADMIFNPSKAFATATMGATGSDIASIAAHEAGHLFGISHTAVVTSTLFFVLGPGDASADLEVEDRLMFLKAYPDSATLAGASLLGGIVTDGSSGEPVPGAIVFAVSALTGDTLGCDFTLPDGSYAFLGLPDGEYFVDLHPLDGSPAVGYLQPGHINWFVASTAVSSFVPESWDLAESFGDDPLARDAIAVIAGTEAAADIVTNVDVTPPVVTQVIPSSGSAGVSANAVVLVQFSEAIDPATVAGNFRLVNTATSAAVGGAAGILTGDSLIAFTPWGSLAFETQYELTVDVGIADRAGNTLEAAHVATFATEAEPPLHIADIVPASASAGSVLILTGSGFDPDPAGNAVHFSGADAVPFDGSSTLLVVSVPPLAGTGEVTVETSLGMSNAVVFTELPAVEASRVYLAGTVGTGDLPRSLAVAPDGGYVYVATSGGLLAVVADPGSPDFLSAMKVAVEGGLADLDVTPDGKRVYGVSRASGVIHAFDSDPADGELFNTCIATLATGGEPLGVLVEPSGARAFVPMEGGAIQIWDVSRASASLHKQIGIIPAVDPNLTGMTAVDPAASRLFALAATGRLLVFDMASLALVADIGAAADPRGVSIDPSGGRAYVSDGSGSIAVISLDGYALVQDVSTGGSPRGLDITPAGQFLYAANRSTNVLNIVDLRGDSPSFRSVVGSVPQGINPVDVALSPDGLYAYAIAEEDRSFSVTAIGVGPAFRSLSRRAGPVGAKLVIAGSEFEGSCAVDFTGPGGALIRSLPERATESAIAVPVPAGTQSGPVSVVDGTGRRSNGQYFRALGPTPAPGRLRLMNGAAIDPSVDAKPLMRIAPAGDQAIIGTAEGKLLFIDLDASSPTYNQTLRIADIGEGSVTAIALAPDGAAAYVTLENAGSTAGFYVVNANRHSEAYGSVIDVVDFGSYPAIVSDSALATAEGDVCVYNKEISIRPDGALCLIQDACSDLLYVVDILPGSPTENEVVDTVLVPRATEIAFHPGGEYAYISSAFLFEVHVLDLNPESATFGEVVNGVELPSPNSSAPLVCHPLALDFTPDGRRCLVLGKDYTSSQPYIHTLDTSDPRNPYQAAVDVFGEAFPMYGPNSIEISPRGDRCIVSINEIGLMNIDVSAHPFAVLDHFGDGLYDWEVDAHFSPDGDNVFVLGAMEDTLVTFDFGAAASLAVVSGDGQTGVAGEALPASLKVRVLDAGGAPAEGVAVTFQVTDGGGSFVGTGTQMMIAATDGDGIASASWRLGPNLGTQSASAYGYGLDGSPAVFTAEAIEDPSGLPLELAAFVPASGSTDVSVTTAIKATFSRAVDPATVGASTFFLRKTGDEAPVTVSYGFTAENREVSLVPLAALDDGAEYVIEVTGAMLDADGGPVQNPQTSAFATSAPPPLALHAICPPSAVAYATVILSGSAFDAAPSNNTVLFGSIEAVPVAGGFDYLEVKVPPGVGSASVRVVAAGDTSNAVAFIGLVPSFAPVDEVIATVSTGYATQAIAVTSDGARAYAISPESDAAVPIDLAALVPFPGIAVGDHPVSVAIQPGDSYAYVANFNSGTVSKIDIEPGSIAFHTVLDHLRVGANPIDLAASPDGCRLYVANAGSGSISVIDTDERSETYDQTLATIATEGAANCVAIAPDGSRIYVGTDTGYLILDPVSYGVLARINTGSSTKTVTIAPDGTLMFLLTAGGEVFVVDVEPGSVTENAVVARITGGSTVSSVTIKPDGALLYLIQEESDIVLVVLIEVLGSVAAIDPEAVLLPKTVRVSVVDSLWAGEDPEAIAFDPTGSGVAYVTNAGPQTITVLNTSDTPYITCSVDAPPDSLVIVYSVETLVRFDFGVINTSPNYGSAFDYALSTTGPGTLAEEEGTGALNGTTPALEPGQSHVVTGAMLVIPGDHAFVLEEQIVYFDVAAHEYPERRQSARTVFTLKSQPVAVLVSEFDAIPFEGGVKLNWDVSTDDPVEGFRIYRTDARETMLVSGEAPLSPERRSFDDLHVAGGEKYSYVLGVLTSGGEARSFERVVQAMRCALSLKQNVPNPFNPATKIIFTLPERAHVRVYVYSAEGKRIATLVDGVLEEGLREVVWDGRNERGNAAASGVYFCRLSAGKHVLTRKMVLIR